MSREFSHDELIAINEPMALFHFNRAHAAATKMMADVDEKEVVGYDDMWMLYFYDYFRSVYGEEDTLLQQSIDDHQKNLDAARERAESVPWELRWKPEDDEALEELKSTRKRGRMLLKAFEWLSPTSRRKKLPEQE